MSLMSPNRGSSSSPHLHFEIQKYNIYNFTKSKVQCTRKKTPTIWRLHSGVLKFKYERQAILSELPLLRSSVGRWFCVWRCCMLSAQWLPVAFCPFCPIFEWEFSSNFELRKSTPKLRERTPIGRPFKYNIQIQL